MYRACIEDDAVRATVSENRDFFAYLACHVSASVLTL